MSSSVFKVYEEDRDRNLLLPQEIGGGGLDDSSTTEDGNCPVEATSSSGSSSSGVVDERLKIDSNLVIVVGKDGSVHVDQKTLHSLLANETTDTSVSVVRIASPTPSIEDEIEQERRQKLEDEQLQQELEAAGLVPDDAIDGTGSEDSPESSNAGTLAGPSGVSTRRSRVPATTTTARKEDVLLDGADPPHVSLMVEGFYPPEEARKFATEVLTLAGLRKPLTVETEPVDYEFKRYVVANDHCYTPLTSPSQKLPPRSFEEQVAEEVVKAPVAPQQQQVVEEGPSGRRRVVAAVSRMPPTKVVGRPRKKSVEESSSNDAEDLQSILEGSDSDSDYTEESSYPEEDDNLSDLDFDISGKSQSKKRKSGSSKNKSGSKKKDETAEAAKKKSVVVAIKSPTKKSEAKLVTPVSMVTKSAIPKTYGPKKPLEVVTPPIQPVVVAPPPPVPQVKKIKQVPKPAPHVEALFSDMTSLFSTPDIIKKVGQSKVVTPTTPTPSSSRGGFVQLIKGSSQKLPAQISIQTHASASEESLIDVLAQDPDPTPPAISTTPTPLTEDIVKMLENNLPPGVVAQEPVLPITDNSILAALSSNDDGGLPEDLLQHVAELAENKELQEILDKQVLGVIGTDVPAMPLASTSAAIPIAPQQMMQPVIVAAPPQPVLQRPQPQQPPAPTPAESLPTMTVKEQLMPRKEAIQIRRSDGRIITLPPIEAPATRSKRRAQTGTSGTPVASSPATAPIAASPSTPIAVPSVASINTPQSSKTSAGKSTASKVVASAVGITSYDDGSGSLMIDETPRGKAGASRSAASSRRTSESSNNSGRGKRQSTAAVAVAVAAEAEEEVESDESWNSEDDPDRLWCICRQPHNNRFMICCDVCEDWFHGKCVNITKAMGQQMEADGIEWTCPNCLRKKQEKQQPKMTDFLVSSSSSNTSIGASSATALTMSPKTVVSITSAPAAASTVAIDPTSCVVCGKVARANSVYCSDACIRKHAHGVASETATVQSARSTAGVKQQTTIVGGIKKLDGAGAKAGAEKSGPIIVMERKTGRCLTGKNAPTAENLKAWLQSHPTFEVVPPGSPQAAIILAKQAEVRKLQQAKESQKKTTSSPSTSQQQQQTSKSQKHSDNKKNALFAPSIPQKVTPQSSKATPPAKTFSKTTLSSPTSVQPPKSSSSSGSLGSGTKTPASTTTTTPATKAQKRPAAAMEGKSVSAKTTPPPAGGENIRVTVKKTLKEHLLQRTSELDEDKSGAQLLAVRLSESEIDAFVAEVEEEMFGMFNKDTGTKYRAKYRSLVFNIKDRKNLSLFQKICEKRIEARQLVRMTPEELASQELAQWRENENKHQLEMIKKSELDLLACAKNYVLKTHKGEEVIEGKIVDRVQLDPTTAVEDVVAVLNNSTVSSTSELDNSAKEASFRSKDFDLSFGKYSTGLYGSGSITSSTLTAAATSASSSASKKKDSRRSRSRSRDRRRDRSRDRSRSKHKRRRSRSRSKSRDRARSRHRDHRKQDSKEQKLDEKPATASAEKDRNEAVGKPVELKKTKKVTEVGKSQTPESGNLIDQILASAGASIGKPTGDSTEMDSTPLSAPVEPPKQTPATTTTSASPSQDQEPTSTVTIPTPPHSTEFDAESPSTDFGASPEEDPPSEEAHKVHWSGNVHMVDVASVEMSIRAVSGSIEDVAGDFSEDLDICGTIKPEIVWDYIGQIKKSANKEICLVRFHSNERAAYYTLYTHLFSRKRYSVIKSPSKAIKDFYVFPLPSEQMVPMILKPLNGVGIVEGDKKPDLLLGIIVKVGGGKRASTTAITAGSSVLPAKTPRRTTKSSTAVSPSFALMQQVITKYATKKPDLDSSTPPGSPGGPVAPPPPVISLPKPPPPPPASASAATPPVVIQIRSRSASESPEQDIDMDIIKRPVLKSGSSAASVPPPEVSPAPVVIDDDDEPYSPGGASDDSDQFADVTAIVETKGRRASLAGTALDPDSERFRLEMEEINRKIAEEKSEIVGIISSGELKADEIKSTLTPSLITDISIPSNLSEILASINKSVPGVPLDVPKAPEKTVAAADDEDEYVPTATSSLYSAYKPGYSYGKSAAAAPIPVLVSNPPPEASTSKLSQLSEAELLSMVPDESYLQPATATKSRVVDGVVELDSDDSEPLPPQAKKSKIDDGTSEPPPPGLEDEIGLA
uniref:Death-inducer obliterator 1 n=1 Tax=Culex pipiens TaxID=7175 RepID=A0A8D8FKD7_CULPI